MIAFYLLVSSSDLCVSVNKISIFVEEVVVFGSRVAFFKVLFIIVCQLPYIALST